MPDTKHLFRSKTFWFNLAMFAVVMGNVLPGKYAPIILAAGNLILRLMLTKTGLTVGKGDDAQ